MSDTEDTEEFVQTSKISSEKKNIIYESFTTKEELTTINTIELISDLFINICEENKTKKSKRNILLKSFTNKNIPSISIKDYILRLYKHSKVNESTIILILIYIDRICNMNHFILTYYNIHKLILSTFILAIKYNEENYYSMTYYSKIGGITLSELNNLESECLVLIGYNLFVKTNLFEKYYNGLLSLKCDDEEENEEGEDIESDADDAGPIEENGVDKNNNKEVLKELYQNEKIKNKSNVNDNYEREIIRA